MQNSKEKVYRAHFAVVIIFTSLKLNLTQQPNQRDGFAVCWRPAFGRDRSYAVWEIQHGRCCPVHPRVSRHDHQKITGIRLRQLSKHGGRWAFFSYTFVSNGTRPISPGRSVELFFLRISSLPLSPFLENRPIPMPRVVFYR